MWIKHFSTIDAVAVLVALATLAGVALWLIPGKPIPRTQVWSDPEICAHDRRLAKYFTTGAICLVLGGLHMVVKNLPGVDRWLFTGAYGGHMARDLANTHILIVGGGTLLLTGTTWYTLPRICRRPLHSETLATVSFWCTTVGVVGFYVVLVAVGLVEAHLVHGGRSYLAARADLGKWHGVPLGMTAGVMGIGYWTYVANVLMTAYASKGVRTARPQAHLLKYLVTGALGLLVGTIQGVIQVQPANFLWLHKAGAAGDLIDPVSHAHINLVTGVTMALAGLLFAHLPGVTRRSANRAYAVLLVGSLAFYATTLGLGLVEGSRVVDRGWTPEQAAESLGLLHSVPLVVSAATMFTGFWMVLAVVVSAARRLPASDPLRSFALLGSGCLALGTLQGPVQALPPVEDWLEGGGVFGDAIVNVHAQLNMVGGLILIMTGLAVALLPRTGAREAMPAAAQRRLLGLVAGGMLAYYGAEIATNLRGAQLVHSGVPSAAAFARLQPLSDVILCAASAVVLVGMLIFARFAWRTTGEYRAVGRREVAATPDRFAGRIPDRVRRKPLIGLVGIEAGGCLLGIPGAGWLEAGRPFAGLTLICVGSSLSWAVLPLAFSPFGAGPLHNIGWPALLAWLPIMAAVSCTALVWSVRRDRAGHPGRRPRRERYPHRGLIAGGAGTLLFLLVCLPLIPWLADLNGDVRYSYSSPFAAASIGGAYAQTTRGAVQLYPWGDVQNEFPADAPVLGRGQVRSLTVIQDGLDSAPAYQLFDLSTGRRVPLAGRVDLARQTLRLTPRDPLPSGRYLLSTPKQGMFGDRDYQYFAVAAPGETLTPIAPNRTGVGDQRSLAAGLIAAFAFAVAAVFAARIVAAFVRRRRPELAFWGAGFVLFAVACAAETAATLAHWSPGLFRAYYLCGGVLLVGFLGVGSLYRAAPAWLANAAAGALIGAAIAATASVVRSPIDSGLLASSSTHGPPSDSAIGSGAVPYAIAINSLGTLALVGLAALSAWRAWRGQQPASRVAGNVLLVAGALLVALASGATRIGVYELLYLGQAAGVTIMFAGYQLLTGARRQTPVRPRSDGALSSAPA
jgi:cbb3-type cytochrome oxidase subunit 1